MSWKLRIEIAYLCIATLCIVVYLWLKLRQVLNILELPSKAFSESPIWIKAIWIGIAVVLLAMFIEE